MALGKAMGPGGRIARAEKKVDKAKEKVSKVAKNLISSRDTPSEYDRKRAIQGKTEAKVSKAVAKVDKAKAKVDKAVGKEVVKTLKKRMPKSMNDISIVVPSFSGPMKQAVKQKTFKRK